MTERPIPFKPEMVRAVLDGTKTQTRRVVKPLVADRINNCPGFLEDLREVSGPYGKPGDRLWVREAWRGYETDDALPPREIRRHTPVYFEATKSFFLGYQFKTGKLRPGMFMPRWASRITLEVTGVRVERLQEIGENDAMAEGVERVVVGDGWRRYCDTALELAGVTPCETARCSYESLWESINGPGSWAANPWVWVVEFKRLTP